MTVESIPVVSFKPDLRSAKGSRIQRGLLVRLSRVLSLIFLDILSLTLAWELTVIYSPTSHYSGMKKTSFLILALALQIGTIAIKGLYKSGSYRRNYSSLFQTVSTSQLFLLLITFVYEQSSYIPCSDLIIFWLLSITFICTQRYLFDLVTKLLRQKGVMRHSIFLITNPEEKESHVKIIEKENCYTIQGIANSSCLDLRNRETTFEYLRRQGIVEAFVSWNAIKDRLYIFWDFRTAGITVRILPSKSELRHPKSTFWLIGGVPCLTISAPFIIGTDFLLKRCFDLCCSIILLLLLSPVYLLIVILIKFDSPGPIFFRQDRIGLHGRKFKIWKFRTMIVDAEKLQASLEAKNEIKDGILFKIKDDPRVTPVGKFLRRYSLDELPQLFNVFLGEMSLVGPRPLPCRDVEKFTSRHLIRQEVLPGITGLWQVSGRSDIDNFEDAFKLDIAYIENWSFWLDLKILLKTVKVVLQKTGAY